jgi:hypothetical protein
MNPKAPRSFCDTQELCPRVRSANELGPSLSALARVCRRVSQGAEDLCVALTPQSDTTDAQELYIQLSWLLERLAALAALKSRIEELREDALLTWFSDNDADVKSFEIGAGADKVLIWPTLERKTKLRGAGEGNTADQAALTRRAAGRALSKVLGALGAEKPAKLAGVLEPFLSANALKHGSCKAVLTAEEWDECWEVVEPKKLATGRPKKKLGIAHERFLKKHRKE